MNATDLSGHFSLGMLARVTEKFVAPAGEFDPAGEWVNRYALYCLIHNNRRKPVYGIRVGSLRLARRLSSARQTRLEFDYRMVVTPDRAHRLAGSLLCARDELATPLAWDYRAEFSPPLAGRPEPALRIRHTMQVRGENLVMNAAGSSRRLARPQRYSCLWALFDAVQRLPRDSAMRRRSSSPSSTATTRPGRITGCGTASLSRSHWAGRRCGCTVSSSWARASSRRCTGPTRRAAL